MKVFPIFLSLVFISLLSFGQTKKQRSILVLSVNLYISTYIGIPCEKFEKAFENRIDTNKVCSIDSIEMLDKFLDNVQYAKDNKILDTRAKLIFVNKSGKNVTLCLDMFRISVDGASIVNSPAFYNYLRSLMPKKNLYSRMPKTE